MVLGDRETFRNRELYWYKSAISWANHHVIAWLRRTSINAFVSVDQVHIPANPGIKCTRWTRRLLHYGNSMLDRALHSASLVDRMESWLLGKIILSISVAVPTPRRTAGVWQLLWVRTLGVVLRWVLLFYRGISRCGDVRKHFYCNCSHVKPKAQYTLNRVTRHL